MYESGHLISTYTWPLDDTVVKEKVTCRLTRVVSKFLRRIQDYSIQDRQVLRAEELSRNFFGTMQRSWISWGSAQFP